MITFEVDSQLNENCGIVLRNLSFNSEISNSEEYKCNVYGEFSLKNHEDYDNLELKSIFYDDESNIINIERDYINLDGFLGSGTFDFWVYLNKDKLIKTHKIKIIPSKLRRKILKRSVCNNKISIESENLSININLKKDYSEVEKRDRKKELIKDIDETIDALSKSDEIINLINYYD
ncbi:MAG: hypothetical protein MJ226_07760 [archaeon]|nr:MULTISPECIES: hypothetical protein [Methanobrevibacter]MCQ2971461.1 hypothetical protein [archaeon]OEC94543.1 hypothetical protein A9505_08430 [Methanobrevibacter sp. A27]